MPLTTSETQYNGDIVDGIPVITALNVNSLAPGKIHRFMFKGADMNIGQSWYVPVMVARGSTAGSNLLLNTGVHGDELNGSRVIQLIFEKLDPTKLSGTLIAVMQASPNSLLHISRHWLLSTDGGEQVNMNRVFPGKKDGNTAQVHAYKLWHHLWLDNVDMAIDLHTQSTDTEYPLFIYAAYSEPGVQHLAELFPADQIKMDEGVETSGAVENAFNAIKVPAITLEVGGPRRYQNEYISRAVEGITNVMIDKKMLKGKLGRTAADFGTAIAANFTSVEAQGGGYAEVLVAIGETLRKGQIIAYQRNAFGDVTREYTAPVAGLVAAIGTGATREAGGLLVRILW